MKPPLDLAALLKPIAGRNLAGEDIRYSKLYQQIREARATDGLVESKIDWNLILKKSTEGLTEKSKDLQLAVWIVEALTQMDGFAGTANGLRLLRCLLEQYWDTLYPQIDPDDEEPLAFRLSIMEWVNTRLPGLLQSLPLTSGETNYSLAHWLVTQKTGAAKEGFLADGWPSSEQFTEALDKSPLAELEDLERDTKSCRDSLAELEQLADNLFVEKKALSTGDTQAVPLLGFRQLRETIENCFWVVERAAKKQRDLSGPSTAPEPAEAPAVIEATEGPDASEDSPRAAALPSVEKASREQTSPVQPPRPQPVTAAQPGDPSQATAQIFDLAALLRKDNPCRPIPYLLSRAVRWGHLLGFSDLKSAEPLSAPSSELRKKLRSLCQQEKWSDLLSEAETALSSEDTGAWLDLHRYTVVAMEKLGADYGPAALSVRGLLRVLLEVHPVLPEADLAD
ncbi:MAG: type VI secretion system protein TssA, partial [Acidobacteria bacterium]